MTWTCLDCLHTGHLDSHGRCARCSSDAVAIGECIQPFEKPQIDLAWVRRVVEEASK